MQVIGPSGNTPPIRQGTTKPPKAVSTPATAPKKRTRKPKEKIPPKAPKISNPKVPQSPVQGGGMSQAHYMSPSSSGPGGPFPMSQQTHTQLSPSVEEMVSEAWNQQMHQHPNVHQHPPAQTSMTPNSNPEEDIMGIQLQSLLSGHNVTTGHQNNTSSNFSDSFEGQTQSFPQISSTPGQIFSPDNMINTSKGQQPVNTGFNAENTATSGNKLMPGQPMTPGMLNVSNQQMTDNGMINQQIPTGKL